MKIGKDRRVRRKELKANRPAKAIEENKAFCGWASILHKDLSRIFTEHYNTRPSRRFRASGGQGLLSVVYCPKKAQEVADHDRENHDDEQLVDEISQPLADTMKHITRKENRNEN